MNITFYGGYYKKSEPEGFIINNPEGRFEWLLLHFYTPMVIVLDNKRIETQANACILYKPGTAHNYYARFGSFENDYIIFRPENRDFFKEYNLPVNEVFYVNDFDVIKTEMQSITWLLTDKAANHDYELAENMSNVLKKLQDARVYPDEKAQRESETIFRLKQLREEVKCHPEKWTVEAMAGNFYLSRSHFSVLYKKTFGVAPKEDIKFFLNEKSIALLLTTEKTVQEIAQICGYNECENFIRAFKKLNEISPLQFRKKMPRKNAGQ